MLKISDVVRQLVQHDGYAIEGMQKGILNLSSYAKTIQQTVEDKCMKPVQLGSIVVALTRISEDIHEQILSPHVIIDRFSITSNLYDITYERTQETVTKILSLPSQFEKTGEFFTITQGMHEVTIICAEAIRDEIVASLQLPPKAAFNELVAVSVRFPNEYLEVPNTIYSLVGILALRHINIMEIISTYTELTFIIRKEELKATIDALEDYK